MDQKVAYLNTHTKNYYCLNIPLPLKFIKIVSKFSRYFKKILCAPHPQFYIVHVFSK